jgi:hypothetical protein
MTRDWGTDYDKYKKNKDKDIVLLNIANEAASCLVALANKESDTNFSSLEEMSTYTKEQVA